MSTMKDGRRCGTCTECCTALAVPELEKAQGERCRHLVAPGKCGIYETRPTSCRAYSCGWLVGALGSQDRPDRTGFILEAQTIQGASEKEPAGLVIRETRAGASLRERAQAVIRRVKDERVVILVPTEGDRKVLGPPHLVSRVLAAASDLLAQKRAGSPS